MKKKNTSLDKIERMDTRLWSTSCSAPRAIYEECLKVVPKIVQSILKGNGLTSGGVFLVVDDSSASVELAVAVAKAYRFEKASGIYGANVIDDIRRADPDLILIDLLMPTAGESLVDILRATMPWVNLVIWSSSIENKEYKVQTFNKGESIEALGIFLRCAAAQKSSHVKWKMSNLDFDLLERHFEHGIGAGSDAELEVKGIVADLKHT